MTTRPPIASFWTGSDLSFVEQLVLRSYLDAGHAFTLYTIGPVGNVPADVTIKDAAALCPPPFDISDNDRTRVAVYSDLLRLYLIRDLGCVWVDMDAYCRRPLEMETPYLFGDNGRGRILTGILGLPPDSLSLTALLTFLTTKNPLIPWRGAQYREERAAALAAGKTWTIADLPWGVTGPKGLSYFLKQNDEAHYALPQQAFYPLMKNDLKQLWRSEYALEKIEPDGCYSVHLFGVTRKVLAQYFHGLPPAGGYIDMICQRHGITPKDAPVPLLDWMKP